MPCLRRAAEAAKERTGAEVVPVFVSLDPEHDKPQQLAKIVQAAGSPSLLALTGDADGVRPSESSEAWEEGG